LIVPLHPARLILRERYTADRKGGNGILNTA